MAYYRRFRNSGSRYGDNRNFRNRDDQSQERVKKLDMRKEEEFRYLLSKIIENLPDSLRGAIKGSVYSIASKKGVKDAKQYIIKKREEGLIDPGIEKRLIDLVYDYSKYR